MPRHRVSIALLTTALAYSAGTPAATLEELVGATAERLGMTEDQVVINIERYGNTTAATVPLATRDALESGRLKKGDIVLFAAVGAGFTVGANLWRWTY